MLDAFAQKNIPWLKNLSQLFKQLMDKHERQCETQIELRQDVIDYQTNVCEGGQNSYFRTDQQEFNDDQRESRKSGIFVLKSHMLAPDESFENKISSHQADSVAGGSIRRYSEKS
jgi:hypothetical protein